MRFVIIILFFAFIYSCSDKDNFDSSGTMLTFSNDTITFDTVFTGIGSATKRFKVYNKSNKKIRINSIGLAKGMDSKFHLNVDGVSANTVYSVDIPSDDSIYIFVEVFIDPSIDDLIEKDSIVFHQNNYIQDVKTIAFGQNVNLINGQIIETKTWTNEKPYLIYNSAMVDTLEQLTIAEGTKIYIHAGASLFVKGSLHVNGSFEEPVIFQGDRLEPFYDDKPGQWGAYTILENGGTYVFGGIHFLQGSFNNTINFAEIKNANQGIQVDSAIDASPALTISNTKISNMNMAGIYAQNSRILGYNLVINNCGTHAIALTLGGWYEFYHTTIANYTPYSSRSTASVALNNYYTYNNQNYTYDLEQALFVNSIIYGDGGEDQNEIVVDIDEEKLFNYHFKNCMVKLNDDFDISNNTYFSNIIKNPEEGPRFVSEDEYNFELDTLSPAIDQGDITVGNLYPLDLNQFGRTLDEAPDLGAYERNE